MVPEPKKRPRSSYIRFQAEQPNQCWQSDFTHWPLADGTGTEILTWLDDHSRYALQLTARHAVTGQVVLATFRGAVAVHGMPAAMLTDNGDGVHHPARRPRRPQRLRHELRRLGVTQKNGKPNHPQTQGKVERFQQTLKKWLGRPVTPAATLTELQAQLDAFTGYYNTRRPHRSLPHRNTPAAAFPPGPKPPPAAAPPPPTTASAPTSSAQPAPSPSATPAGSTTSASAAPTPRTHVLLLVPDLHVRIIDAATGELLRDLTLDPDRNYQPTRTHSPNPHPPADNDPAPPRGFGAILCLETSHWWGRWDSNPHCQEPKSCASCRWATAPASGDAAGFVLRQTPSSARSRATCPVAFTAYCAFSILPSRSTTKVDRMTPTDFLP